MAATDLFRRAPPAPAGALPQTPALLRDGQPRTVKGGAGQGHLLAGWSSMAPNPRPGQGRLRRRTRGRKRPPCPVRGTGGTTRGLPDEEMPNPSGNRAAGPAGGRTRTTTMNRCSVRTKQNDHLLVEQGRRRVTVDDTDPSQTARSGRTESLSDSGRSNLPGRPITPATLGERLRALGIYAQVGRRAAAQADAL